mmetsp:Transcript_3530/g.5306  ORF Transcript_3530/g.5306 Transcript_3530/m.5306 type:complete len:81 (+) Transcript_3530:1038-1280(+)
MSGPPGSIGEQQTATGEFKNLHNIRLENEELQKQFKNKIKNLTEQTEQILNNQIADDSPNIPGKKKTSLLTNRNKMGGAI